MSELEHLFGRRPFTQQRLPPALSMVEQLKQASLSAKSGAHGGVEKKAPQNPTGSQPGGGKEPIATERKPKSQTGSSGIRTFANSNFKRLYDQAEVPDYQDELLFALRSVLVGYCKKHGLPEDCAKLMFEKMQREAFKQMHELLSKVESASQRVWTSAIRLDGVPKKHALEFCSILNRSIREDDGNLLKHGCVIIRGINALCSTRGREASWKFPEGNSTFRGGALPLVSGDTNGGALG